MAKSMAVWLLAYRMPVGVYDAFAIFDSREAALDMAARIDELTGVDHFWRVDTAFNNPQDVGELVALLGIVDANEQDKKSNLMRLLRLHV